LWCAEAKSGRARDLDFCGGENHFVDAFGWGMDPHGPDPPTGMNQCTAERWLPGEITCETNGGGIEPGFNFDAFVFLLRQDRLEIEGFSESVLTFPVEFADRKRQLTIIGLGDVFHQEVEQAPLSLQESQ
jgi:hypothetical protein